MMSLKEYINESILDPIRQKFSSDLWANEIIKKSASAHIIKKAEAWLKSYTNQPIKKIFLIGSMAGFQYNDTSDIDINIVIPISDEKLKEMTKFLPNGQLLPGTKHPVNYFISNKVKLEWKKAGPIYDMIENKWITKPGKEESKSVVSNYRAVIEIARFFIAGLNSVISEYERDVADYRTYESYLEDAKDENKEEIQKLMQFKLQEILADVDSIGIADYLVHSLRKTAFLENKTFETRIEIIDKTANSSINNLIYKYLEKLGYFTKIINIKNEAKKWEKTLK